MFMVTLYIFVSLKMVSEQAIDGGIGTGAASALKLGARDTQSVKHKQ
jgi:hypothetical protein